MTETVINLSSEDETVDLANCEMSIQDICRTYRNVNQGAELRELLIKELAQTPPENSQTVIADSIAQGFAGHEDGKRFDTPIEDAPSIEYWQKGWLVAAHHAQRKAQHENGTQHIVEDFQDTLDIATSLLKAYRELLEVNDIRRPFDQQGNRSVLLDKTKEQLLELKGFLATK